MKIFEFIAEQAHIYRQKYQRPLVSLCYAQSLDGSLTARPGSPTQLSGARSGILTHELRAAHDAILVGSGTVLADQPRLTVRLAEGEHPQPVILDGRLRTPPDCFLVGEHPKPAWIAAGVRASPARRKLLSAAGARLLDLPHSPYSQHIHLPALLEKLAALGIRSLMVEGGAHVIASFLTEGLADQALLTIAPVFTGGLHIGENGLFPGGAPPSSGWPRLKELEYDRFDEDLIVWGKFI